MSECAMGSWMGTPIEDLSKDELIEVVRQLGGEVLLQRKDLARWMKCGDAAQYLINKVDEK